MSRNYQEFKKDLFNPKKKKELLFYKLKNEYSFEEQVKIIRQIPRTFHGLLYGYPLFKNESRTEKNAIQYRSLPEKQLNWDAHLYAQYAKEINEFLALKDNFERAFLKGDYGTARAALNSVQESVGYSYWGLENLFLLTQYEKGLEHNFRLLNECKSKATADGSYFMYVHFFSYKVEEDISFITYENTLNHHLKYFKGGYKNYFEYRLNPIECSYENIGDILWISTKDSLVDRYLLFRDVLAHLLTKPQFDEQLFQVGKYLLEQIADPLLTKIVNYIEGNFDSSINISSSKAIEVIDSYSTGKYEDSIRQAASYLNAYGPDLGVLEIFVKAHIFLGCPLGGIAPSQPCFLDRIAALIHDYLGKNAKTTESLVEMLTISNAISSFEISKCLVAFLEFDMDNKGCSESKKAYLYSKIFNPSHHYVWEEAAKGLNFLKCLAVMHNSATVQFFQALQEQSGEVIEPSTIPIYRVKFYYAKSAIIRNQLKEARLLLESIMDKCVNVGFFQEAVTQILFTCYIELNEVDLAVRLFVSQFIKNNELTYRIDATPLAKRIVDRKFRDVIHNQIELPIFIYLAHNEAHAKFIAYDLYMRSLSVNRPTQLTIVGPNHSLLIYFLRYIATPKVISKKVLIFKNSSEVLKERIAICQMLVKVDSSATAEYTKEISENTQRLIVQQRIKEIDQSMIYVDENGIISHELSEILKNFNRFRNISELLKSNKIDATGINLEALYSLVRGEIDTDTYQRSVRKTSIHFQVFEQLFLDIRDKFLFSNHYGLDYYLSQRIRHGTIIGQLRKHFQEYNLVTSKDTSEGSYLTNKYWSDRLNLPPELNSLFIQRMADFSSAVDKVILDLKNKFIQIKTEDPKTSPSGWFDYMYIPEWDGEELRLFFLSKIQYVTDFQDFVNIIFEVLWGQTTRILESIRRKIESNIKVHLISILDDLEIDLVPILGTEASRAMLKNIADCRTSVQEDVDAVVRWFNKSKSDEVDFTLMDAFNTSLTIINNINSPFAIVFEEQLENKTFFKGTYFPHFVDLLKIFINNIFTYYHDNSMLELKGHVVFSISGNLLTITFSNLLATEEKVKKLNSKVESIKKDLERSNYQTIRREGNTGFSKAHNIVTNVFRNTTNALLIKIDEGRFITTCLIDIRYLTV